MAPETAANCRASPASGLPGLTCPRTTSRPRNQIGASGAEPEKKEATPVRCNQKWRARPQRAARPRRLSGYNGLPHPRVQQLARFEVRKRATVLYGANFSRKRPHGAVAS